MWKLRRLGLECLLLDGFLYFELTLGVLLNICLITYISGSSVLSSLLSIFHSAALCISDEAVRGFIRQVVISRLDISCNIITAYRHISWILIDFVEVLFESGVMQA